jgi:hypothetical protein
VIRLVAGHITADGAIEIGGRGYIDHGYLSFLQASAMVTMRMGMHHDG